MNLGFGKLKAQKPKVNAHAKISSLNNSSSKKNYLKEYLTKKDPYSEKVKEEIALPLKKAMKEISLQIIKNNAAQEYQKHLTKLELVNKLKMRIRKMTEFKQRIENRKKELVAEGFDADDVYDEFDEDEVLGDEDEIDMILKEFLDEGNLL